MLLTTIIATSNLLPQFVTANDETIQQSKSDTVGINFGQNLS